MDKQQNRYQTRSPFHQGEKDIQSRMGKRESMEQMGRKVIRSYMPDQHRAFFSQLPFLVIGSVDPKGWPWVSFVAGKPGFVTSPDPTSLEISALVSPGDALQQGLTQGAPLGLLGIEVSTRRRNRLNTRITATRDGGFTLNVDQSFGNCPQYIQTRDLEYTRDPGSSNPNQDAAPFTTLNQADRAIIRGADTFFVSSYVPARDRPEIEGVDVSHRGGRAGFVKVDGNTLTIPDYAGNNLYMTLGNFLTNPKAGLTFIDFDSGSLLQLTGTVELLLDEDPEIKAFLGAERGWRFTVDHGVRLNNTLPFRFNFGEYSPNSLLTDDWSNAAATLAAETQSAKARQATWRPFRVVRMEDESSHIRSIYLEPDDGDGLADFHAGQYLPIRVKPSGSDQSVIRTYTLSSAPGERCYRISVKHEEGGLVSGYLHSQLALGDTIEVKAPLGNFYIDPQQDRPAVLIAGGVGITPMISMVKHVLNEGVRTRHYRQLTIIHAARTTEERAFREEFGQLEAQHPDRIRYLSIISRPDQSDKPGVDFNGSGRLTQDDLRQTLLLDDYDFYLCGPDSFMQTQYENVHSLGVRDDRIHAESFGPSTLTRKLARQSNSQNIPVSPATAEAVIINFSRSKVEQAWTSGDGSLLEFAEAHGLTPESGCRNGACGSCAVKIDSGSVVYPTAPTTAASNGEVLLCCAFPAHDTETVVLAL
ncbi:MAG: pyridoxamine 5'-phosphate oxidase family protein [Motiliproteus sp.]